MPAQITAVDISNKVKRINSKIFKTQTFEGKFMTPI